MSHLPPAGISPRRSRSMAARMRVSLRRRCWALMRTFLLLGRGGGGVDLGDDADSSVVFALQSSLFGFAGGTQFPEKGFGPGRMFGPDRAMAEVVGGLGAA